MEADGLIAGVARFLSGVRRPQPTAAETPSAQLIQEAAPVEPLPFAVAVSGMCSISEVAQLLSATNAEVSRLEQSVPQEKARADAAYSMRNAAGLQQAWDAENQLAERLDNERQRQRLLRERLDELTYGEVSGLNQRVRERAEAISAAQRGRADRLVECVKGLEAVLSEMELEGGRALAAEEERAVAAFAQLTERCAGHAPAGQLMPHQALAHPRLDRIVSALEQIVVRVRALQQD